MTGARTWALAIGLLAGCGGGEGATRAVSLRFASADLRANAAAIEVYVTPGCGSLGSTGADATNALRRVVVVPGTPAPALGEVPAGPVGVYARAHGADCSVFAAGCIDVDLRAGGADPVVVSLAALAGPMGCNAGESCTGGLCVAGADGGAVDAGAVDVFDASTDDVIDVIDVVDALDAADTGGCESGAACDGGCFDLDTDPLHCGACGRACPVPAHGAASCTAGTCGFACDPGYHACGAVCADDSAIDACGAACTVCPVPTNGRAVCQAGACGTVCNPGTLPVGSLCQPPPRPVSPGATTSVASPRPVFRWTTPPGVTPGAVRLCRDRACAQVLQTIVPAAGTAISAAPEADLGPGTVFWRVEATAGAVTTWGATWELFVGPGASPDRALGSAPDLDGDGFADVLAGAPGAGAVLWLRGGTSPASGTWSALASPGAGSQFGASVASAGDVDGDGVGDVLVGAPASNATYLVRGSAVGALAAPVAIAAPARSISFGGAVAAAGDVDGDGYGDAIVGAGASTTGRAYVYRGGPQGLLVANPLLLQDPAAPHTQFGAALSGGDADGDGYSDVAVGAPASNRVYLFPGSALGTATTGVALAAPAGAMRFGAAVSLAGDANGDGLADLVIGAPGADQAFVYPGNRAGIATATAIPLPRPDGATGFGTSVAMVGDIDGDGFGDVAVGAPGANEVFVYPGGASGPAAVPVVIAAPSGASGFGAALAAAGDVDGDGRPDMLVGASGSGGVFLYLGSAAGLVPAVLPATGLPPSAQFGASMAQADVGRRGESSALPRKVDARAQRRG